MNIKKTEGALLIVLILTFCSAEAAQHKGSRSSEQTHFSAEEAGVHNPVPLPDDVLAILKEDEGVRGDGPATDG